MLHPLHQLQHQLHRLHPLHQLLFQLHRDVYEIIDLQLPNGCIFHFLFR